MSPENLHDSFAPKVETDSVPGRRLWITGAAGAFVVAVSVFAADRVLEAAGDGSLVHASPPPAAAQIGIVEQTSIRDTKRGLDDRTQQEESLRHFGWIDREHGIARIPIDRAMSLVADPAFMRRAFDSRASTGDAGSKGGT